MTLDIDFEDSRAVILLGGEGRQTHPFDKSTGVLTLDSNFMSLHEMLI